MIAFDLICEHDHVFEAWFGSSSDYETQKQKGLLTCPFCNSAHISKAIMAPNIGRKGNQKSEASFSKAEKQESQTTVPVAPLQTVSNDQAASKDKESRVISGAEKQVTEMLSKMQSHIEKNFDYVGKNFPEEARKIYHGESDARGIYGEASPDETQELLDEGIDLLPIPMPVRPPKGNA